MTYLIILSIIIIGLVILAFIDKAVNTTIEVIRPIDKIDKKVKDEIDNSSLEEVRDILNELSRR